jgi:hypothetical protein
MKTVPKLYDHVKIFVHFRNKLLKRLTMPSRSSVNKLVFIKVFRHRANQPRTQKQQRSTFKILKAQNKAGYLFDGTLIRSFSLQNEWQLHLPQGTSVEHWRESKQCYWEPHNAECLPSNHWDWIDASQTNYAPFAETTVEAQQVWSIFYCWWYNLHLIPLVILTMVILVILGGWSKWGLTLKPRAPLVSLKFGKRNSGMPTMHPDRTPFFFSKTKSKALF